MSKTWAMSKRKNLTVLSKPLKVALLIEVKICIKEFVKFVGRVLV